MSSASKTKKSATVPSALALPELSWKTVQRNPAAFVLLLLVPASLVALSMLITPEAEPGVPGSPINAGGWPTALYVLGLLLGLLANGGLILTIFQSYRDKTVDGMDQFRKGLRYFWRLIGLAILTGLVYFAALLLLVVPFFIVLPKLLLASYHLVDKDLGVVESMKVSWAQSKRWSGEIWALIGVSFLMVLAMIVLMMIPVVGIVAMLLISLLASCMPVIRYMQIKDAETAAK